METYVYRPKGVCSREMRFEMDGDMIRKVTIVGGCPGNLLGISRMLENKHIDEVVAAFAGVRCGGKWRPAVRTRSPAALKQYQCTGAVSASFSLGWLRSVV